MPLWPHQQEAVTAAVNELANGGRATVVMACGTGKTRAAAETSHRLAPEGRVLVVVPTLELLYQTATEWSRYLGEGAGRIAAVCSEKHALANRSTMEAQEIMELEEAGVLVTTDPAILHSDLKPDGRCTVFVTYASLRVIASLAEESDLPAWDLIVIDEAHRSAGARGRAWSLLHHDHQIPALRRLYMTATPRVYTGEEDVISMDDESVYGPRVYELGFADAIEQGLLADYRLLIAVVTETEIAELTEAGQDVTVDGLTVPARMLAGQIALGRAIQEFDLRRVITYHESIAASKRFVRTLPNSVDLLGLAHERPVFGYHVDGQMRLEERRHTIGHLTHPGQRTVVVSNCRVLSEGIDVPELDAVMFAAPRDSGTDVVQALGRALRTGERQEGKVATIIVPILTVEEESPEAALEGTRWQTVWKIVRALRSHDERIADELDQQRVRAHHPRSGSGERETQDRGWVSVTGQRVDSAFADAVHLRLIQSTTSRWWESYAAAVDFHAEHGHLDAPDGFIDPQGRKLGSWLGWQRSQRRRGLLPQEQISALEELDIVWEPYEERRQQLLSHARAYRDQHGHLHVPSNYVADDGYRLGYFLRIRRGQRQDGSLAAHWIADLDELGMPWEEHNPRFWRLYEDLARFHAEHGHVDVPSNYTTATGVPLGNRMRKLWRRRGGDFTPKERHGLEALGAQGGPEQIQHRLVAAVERFHTDHQHAQVPVEFVDQTSRARVRRWLDDVAAGFVMVKGDIRQRLRELGVDIMPYGGPGAPDGQGEHRRHRAPEEELVERLQAYREQHGHADVPAEFVTQDGYRLGKKLVRLRHTHRRGQLSARVVSMVEETGFVWDPKERLWLEFLEECDRYVAEHGDLKVPAKHVTPQGYSLGMRIMNYRYQGKRGALSESKRAELDKRGMWWGG